MDDRIGVPLELEGFEVLSPGVVDGVLEVEVRVTSAACCHRCGSVEVVGHEGGRQYSASVERDGTIILRPAVVMTELEASFLSNSELVGSIRRQREDPSAYVTRPE